MIAILIKNIKKIKRVKGPSPGWLILFLLAGIIVFSGCAGVNPQTGSLEGVVHREISTGSVPLQDALISVSGSTNTALTDSEGYFLLNEVPAGKRTLTIIKEGYLTIKVANIFVEPDIVNKANLGNPIIIKPKEDRALFDIAYDEYSQGNYQQAMDGFLQLRNDYPDSSWADDAQYFIGFIYESKFNLYIQGILSYYGVLLDYPDSSWADDAQLGIGNCYYATKDYGNAIKEYGKVLDFYPGSELHSVAQYGIAWSYRRAGTSYYSEALAEFRKVIELYPDSVYAPPAQYFIGEIYYDSGQYSQAISEFQTTINHYPQSSWPQEERLIAPAAYFYIGYCHEKLENWEKAIIAYQVIIKKYPKSKWDDGSSIAADAQKRINYINENILPPDEQI